MVKEFYEEGDLCPQCLDDHLEVYVEDCTCHVGNAPCFACTDDWVLRCPECGWEVGDEIKKMYDASNSKRAVNFNVMEAVNFNIMKAVSFGGNVPMSASCRNYNVIETVWDDSFKLPCMGLLDGAVIEMYSSFNRRQENLLARSCVFKFFLNKNKQELSAEDDISFSIMNSGKAVSYLLKTINGEVVMIGSVGESFCDINMSTQSLIQGETLHVNDMTLSC